jgi:hypothetical protein
MNARHEAAAAMLSIDTTKTFPATPWEREPLRKDMAAAPANMARMPALM